ncbi:MAG: hypothetical protein NVS9B3_04800 [Gemmatimonadaceae bacterium]
MQKALLVSIIVASIGLPYYAANDRSPLRGVRRALLWLAVFDLGYAVAVLYVLPRLPG